MKGTDFIAELEFLTTKQGGRKEYTKSGYRPHIEFENYSEYLTSGQQTYVGREIAEPGDNVTAEIAILGTEYFAKRLYENMEFKFCEGSRTIGYGKILEIINNDLKSDPNIPSESINLNLYPIDIIERIKSDFGQNWNIAFSKIQELIISDKAFRSNRIVRAIIYLGNKDVVHLKKMIELTITDWRDILVNAEYDKNDKRIRDFNNEFGNEKIKASR
ncbi:elongation factor Tu [Aquimarina spinulae]|uniref:elongation factor Tu n=1 Tax=Aquimarina spinulae TaxID=1192023 RepID=UPI000D55014F|nr:elongation factor Tu [Aquimarina spinulae]